MPRIPPKVLDCVCYLYPAEDSARHGRRFGGTGFLVAVPSRHAAFGFVYVVTNHHVAVKGGCSVLRLNRRDGTSDIFSYGPEDWHFDPRYDIAVIEHPKIDESHQYVSVPISMFVGERPQIEHNIGVGDDVFMVGRFLDHDGVTINKPAVRFGNISVMPSEITLDDGSQSMAYCIDLHSRSGYSGSPVFLYRTPGYDLEKTMSPDIARQELMVVGNNYLGLLGIHFAQFPESWEIALSSRKCLEASSVPLITSGASVRGLSGMTCVLPASSIKDVLYSPHMLKAREADDDETERMLHNMGNPTASPE